MRRRQGTELEVTAYVEISDVLDEISDEELLEELKERGQSVAQSKDANDVYDRMVEDVREAFRIGDKYLLEIALHRAAPENHFSVRPIGSVRGLTQQPHRKH